MRRIDILGASSLHALAAAACLLGVDVHSASAQTASPPPPSSSGPVVSDPGTEPSGSRSGEQATTAPSSQAATTSAAPEGAPVIQEIVVTAEKRSTNLQKTPVAVTAFTGAALAQAQVRTLQDIQTLAPGLKVASDNGYAQITIRGVGISDFVPGAESAVAVNLDGIFISRQVAQLTSLYDVSSLEVLRGPQGTLYGRNATAGSVNVNTTLPGDQLSGYARATFGDYDLFRAEGAVGGPVVDGKLTVRLAGFEESRAGYGKNLVTGQDIDNKRAYGLRATAVVTPVEHVKDTLIVEYYREADRAAAVHYIGAAGLSGLAGALGTAPLFQILGGYAPNQNSYDIANGRNPQFQLRTMAVTNTLDLTEGPFGIRAITGYRNQRSFAFTSIDGGVPFNSFYVSGEPDHQFSQEIQGHYDTSRLHLTVGGYYFSETDHASPSAASLSSTAIGYGFGLPAPTPQYFVDFIELGGTIYTEAEAAFAQGTYQITDRLSLTAGVRYSREHKSFDQQFAFDLFTPLVGNGAPPPAVGQPPRTFSATNPKVGIQYQLTSRTLLYGTYSQGFKSGSFDLGFSPSLGFRPERLTDYEGGLKTTVLDNKLRFNLAGFYYDYTDLQVPELIGFSVTTTNAATAHVSGAEAEVTYVPIRPLKFDISATTLNAKYINYSGPDAARPLLNTVNFSGNRLNDAPDFTAHVSGEYTWDLPRASLALKVQGDFTSKFFFSAANLPLEGQKGFGKADAFLTYTSDRGWYVSGFVRNMTDKITRLSAVIQSPQLGNPVNAALAPPRTFGGEVGYKF